MNRLFIFILLIFTIFGALGYWYWQTNIYSKEILKLEILSQEFVKAGEEIEYLIKLKNNGKVRLEEPELIFQAPNQSILKDHSVLRVTQKIEDIYPGEERTYSFKARLFAKKGESLTAQAWLTYTPKNLTAQYESKTTFTNKIKFVPLTFEFDLPSKIEKDEQLDFSLNYYSNIDYFLENLRIKIQYPSGFEFIHAEPNPLEEPEWKISSLNQTDGGRIKIRGRLSAERGEQKLFQAQLGMIKDGEFWVLQETSRSIELIEPSLYISQLINNSPDYIARLGEFLHYEIFFKNIGQQPIQKKFLFVSLEGELFDLSTLKSITGEYGAGDNVIVWDWKKNPELRFLDVGQEGKIEFWIKTKELDNKIGADSLRFRLIKNPVLKNEIKIEGIKKTFEIKISSQIELAQRVYNNQEFFDNFGFLFSENSDKSEYVVLWQVRNTWNDLDNVKVKAILPINVLPTGKIFPEDASFTFDPESREIIWNIGKIGAFQYFKTPLNLAFQVESSDSSQINNVPILINQAEILAQDLWTSEILQEKANARDIDLPDDESVIE